MRRFVIALLVGVVFAFVNGCYTIPPQEPKQKSVTIEEHQETTKGEWKETLGD